MADDADNGPADDDDGDSPGFDGDNDNLDNDASVEDDDSAAVEEALDDFQLEPAEDDAVEELFTEVETPDIDGEELWEEVLADPEAATDEPEPVAVDEEPTAVDAGETVVPKEQFCQRCEHFAAPPELACDHPGTEIAAVVDSKQFRVVDCPIVARRNHAESVFPDE